MTNPYIVVNTYSGTLGHVNVSFHDASGTGALGDPSSGIGARVSYAGYYYDLGGRTMAVVSSSPIFDFNAAHPYLHRLLIEEIARGGVYHITFERDTPIQLVRIALPANAGLYPETSGSHYRCSVRLLAWNGLNQRPQQTTDDVPFTLTCCT